MRTRIAPQVGVEDAKRMRCEGYADKYKACNRAGSEWASDGGIHQWATEKRASDCSAHAVGVKGGWRQAEFLRLLSLLLIFLRCVWSHGLRDEREECVSQSALARPIGRHGGMHLR